MTGKPKLAFIGRQYHEKTKSDEVMLKLLKEAYDVEVYRREQHSSKGLIDQINALDPSVVMYWCLPPSPSKHLRKLRCKHHVWAPMWDGFRTLSWRQLWAYRKYRLKVVCFSHSLFEYFKKTGLKAAYWQCFLPPQFPEKLKERGPFNVFFWQRDRHIDLDGVAKLFQGVRVETLYYKSEISVANTKNYPFKIESLTDWLESDAYREIVLKSDFFVAPRISEGIGFSFIYPMSLGRVVMAYNNSTMNEYVVDGENGYLFDDQFKIKHPICAPIDLLPKMKQHAKDYYQRWRRQSLYINTFISN